MFSPKGPRRDHRRELRGARKAKFRRGKHTVSSKNKRELRCSNNGVGTAFLPVANLQEVVQKMKTRVHYEKKFADYPNIVDLITFREMLGGIGDTFARRLVHEKKVKSIFVKPHYWIIKNSVIDYLLSEDYSGRRLKVRA